MGILWSLADLLAAPRNGLGAAVLAAGLLAVLLGSGRWTARPGLLAAGGVCFLLGSVVLTCCTYVMTSPPRQEELRAGEGTAASFTRGIRNRSGSQDCKLYLEGDETLYWISAVVTGKDTVSVSPGDFVRFSYAEKEDGSCSIYRLEVRGDTVLEEEASLWRAGQNHRMTLFLLLFSLEGFILLHMSSRAARDQRKPAPRPGKRRRN